MNAIISDSNFSLLIQGKIDLDSYVVTESLSTISRWNLLGRLYHSSELDSTRVCANIEATFPSKLPVLTEEQRTQATENLKIMLAKFCKTKDSSKEKTCREILERVIGSIKPQEAEPSLPASSLVEQPGIEVPVSQAEAERPVPTRFLPSLVEMRYQQRYRYQLDQRPHCVDQFGTSTVDAVMQAHTRPSLPISTERAGQLLFLCEYRKDKIARFNTGLIKQVDRYFDNPNMVLELVFDIPSSEVGNLKEQLKEGKAEFTHEQMQNLFQVISHPEQVLRNFDEAHEEILPFFKTDAKYQREKALQIKLLSLRNHKVYEQEKEREPVRTAPVAEAVVSKPIPVTVAEKKDSLALFQDFFNRLLAS